MSYRFVKTQSQIHELVSVVFSCRTSSGPLGEAAWSGQKKENKDWSDNLLNVVKETGRPLNDELWNVEYAACCREVGVWDMFGEERVRQTAEIKECSGQSGCG